MSIYNNTSRKALMTRLLLSIIAMRAVSPTEHDKLENKSYLPSYEKEMFNTEIATIKAPIYNTLPLSLKLFF